MSGPQPLPVPDGDPALDQAKQLALELGEQAEWDRVCVEARRDGIYTGDRFRQLYPAKYRIACELLAAGLGVLKIAALLRVSHHTIAAVRDGSGREQIAREKGLLSEQMRLVMRLLLERTVNEIEKIDIEKVPFFIGVFADKMQLLDGQATQRIETTSKEGMTIEAFRDYVAGLAGAIPVAAAEVPAEPVTPADAHDVKNPEPPSESGQNGAPDVPRE